MNRHLATHADLPAGHRVLRGCPPVAASAIAQPPANPPLGDGHADARLLETVDDRVARYRRLYPQRLAVAPAPPAPAVPALDPELRELLAGLRPKLEHDLGRPNSCSSFGPGRAAVVDQSAGGAA